jgi:hypothetical protein
MISSICLSFWLASAACELPSDPVRFDVGAFEFGVQQRAEPGSPTARGDVEWGIAPDGERGFGAGRSLRDIARLLRSSADEDRAVVARLYKLEPDVRVLLALVTDRYKEQGYLASLPPGEASLERLGETFRARQQDVGRELDKGDASSEMLARMLVDARFRSRSRVIDGVEFEIADLRSALALLFAHLDGFADLKDHEAEALARRVDLAAARLRAICLDLEALREKPGSETADAVWAQDLERLLALVHSRDAAQRAKDLPPLLDRLDQREEQMSAALFTTRQAIELDSVLSQRRAAVSAAADLLPSVRELLPETPEGAKAGAEIQALPKSRRYAYAAHSAAQALGYDALNEELNYLAGLATDVSYGQLESRRWFDRFLALRGIRSNEYKTYGDRKLTREEKRALDVVQQLATKPR